MNHPKLLIKKTAATLLASSLLFAANSSVVFASNSYQEIEQATLDKIITELPEIWDTYLDNYQKSSDGASANISLQIKDTGRAFISAMMGGTDISWLQNISINSNVSLKDELHVIASSILLNDTQICDLNLFIDYTNMLEYLQIPELSESYISAPIYSDSVEDIEQNQEITSTYLNMLTNVDSILPDSDSIGTLLDRYGSLIIDNIEENSTVQETVSVDGIGEECTAYEGVFTEKSLITMAEQVLTTAKEDQEIKAIYELWENNASADGSYEEFQNNIDSLLESIQDVSLATDTAVIFSKIWTNSDGKIIGRELGISDDGITTTPVFTWKAPSDGDNSAFLLEISSDDSSLTLTGSGQTTDGLLTGDYILAIDNIESLNIHVEDLETVPSEIGYYNGTFTITIPDSVEDDSQASSLSSFAIVIAVTSDAANGSCAFDVTLTISGAPLATLSITGNYDSDAEYPDHTASTNTYDASSDESMAGYLEDINWDTFLTNIKAAGVPEDLAMQLEETLKAAVESAIAAE